MTMTMSAVEYLNIYYDFFIFYRQAGFQTKCFFSFILILFLAWTQRKVPAMQ